MTEQEFYDRHGWRLNDDSCYLLAAAIVEQACTDYLKARFLAEFGGYKRKPEAQSDLMRIKRWLHSNDFGVYTDIDPDRLLSDLDRRYEENDRTIRERRKRGWL